MSANDNQGQPMFSMRIENHKGFTIRRCSYGLFWDHGGYHQDIQKCRDEIDETIAEQADETFAAECADQERMS
jgi:hypothetical protein